MPDQGRLKQLLIPVLTVIGAGLILFIRKTDSLTNPQLWAEDGTVFFLNQYESGASSLFREYNGYLHLIPRLIALIVHKLLPITTIPAGYNYASLLVTLLVVAALFSHRLELPRKPLLALSVVLVPHYTNEVFLNITNLQWLTSLLLIMTLVKTTPDRQGAYYRELAADGSVLILCGLTGPFSIFLWPFFVWTCLARRSPFNYLRLALITAVASVQLYSVLHNNFTAPGTGHFTYRALSDILGQKFFGNLFLGTRVAYQLSGQLLTLLLLATVVLVLFLAIRARTAVTVSLFLTIAAIVISTTLFKFRASPELLIPPGDGVRYFYLPCVMFVWSLTLCLGRPVGRQQHLATLLLISAMASLTSQFRSEPLPDFAWKYFSRSVGKQAIAVPINPVGWRIELKAKPGGVTSSNALGGTTP